MEIIATNRKLVQYYSGGNPEVVGGFKITWRYLPPFWTDDIDDYIKNRGSGYTLVASDSQTGIRLYVNNHWLKTNEFDSSGYNYLIRDDISGTEVRLINYQIMNQDTLLRLQGDYDGNNNQH